MQKHHAGWELNIYYQFHNHAKKTEGIYWKASLTEILKRSFNVMVSSKLYLKLDNAFYLI